MDYKEALDWLYSTQHFGVKLGLDNAKQLLRKFLAYPSHRTQVLHVAGTNGKGSVCAMMEMLIRGSGHRTALFTSPHLVHFRERMKVNSVMISEEQCAAYLTKLRHVAEGMPNHPTFFELTLAMAMRFFKDEGAEYIVLETGMGGRFDATTAVPADLCVITPVGMDHSEWLGDTLEEIAMEKAGIMLEGVPVISGAQEEEVKTVLLEEANVRRCDITMVDEPLVGYSIGILGMHQRYNANVAVQAVHSAGVYLNYDTVKECLEHVYWPGRFENISMTGEPFVLDGAHNVMAARALVQTWREEFPKTEPLVIFGAVAEKDIEPVLDELKKLSQHFFLVPVDSPRAMDISVLAEALGEVGIVESFDSVEDAITKAGEIAKPVLLTGSLFLVGQVKAIQDNGKFERSSQ